VSDRHHSTRRAGDERGVILLFFAMGLTAMLALGALVLGGSAGYMAVRSAQTAADVAALAGASTLRAHQTDWVTTPASAVLAEVTSVVEDNGAVLEPGGCQLIRAEYAVTRSDADVIADCDQLEYLSADQFVQAAGVRVAVSDTRGVPFGAFVSQDTITGAADAAATAQPLTAARAPVMICASPDAVGHPAPAVVPDAEDPTGYRVNAAAIGKHYVLWGNQIKNLGRDCGNPASDWRGLVKFDQTFAVPSPDPVNDTGWWQTESGNKDGQLPEGLAGDTSCTLNGEGVDDLDKDCLLAVPLCPKGNGSASSFRLSCVKVGAFQITHVGIASSDTAPAVEDGSPCGEVTTNIVCGRFLGGATAVAGQGIAQRPDPNSVVVIKLVE
jgi:Flp pilus assembly protein TadG